MVAKLGLDPAPFEEWRMGCSSGLPGGYFEGQWFDLSWGAMKAFSRIAVATMMAAAGLVFAMSGPAGADVLVAQHKHCLQTPSGWVLIAEGVSEEAYLQEAPALDNFHARVHRGEPTATGGLTIERIDAEQDCSAVQLSAAE
jgi:hypothetical protein